MKSLLRPKAVHLILFTLLLLPLLFLAITHSFFSLFGVGDLINMLLLAGVVLLLTKIVDGYFQTTTTRYGITAIGLLVTSLVLMAIFLNYKENQTEKKGLLLADKIQAYKRLNGHFPDHLNNSFFNSAETKTALGAPFTYSKRIDKNGESFSLAFGGLLGMDAYLSSDNNEWVYTD